MKTFKHFSVYVSLPIIAIMVIMSSCQKHHAIVEESHTPRIEMSANNGKIPINVALKNLREVLTLIDGTTRSKTRTIKDIRTLNFEDVQNGTRSESAHSGEMLYIVNFENNEGYAILGADAMVEPVVAVTNSGGIGPIDKIFNPPTPIDGPTPWDPEDPDYTTLPQYCADDDDFYLGIDSTIIARLIQDYIEYIRIASPPEIVDGCGGDESHQIHYDTVEIAIPAMLKTKWGQDSPFNDNIHMVGNHRRPIGCTTTATVQLMAQQKRTNINIFDLVANYTSWELLETRKFAEDFESDPVAKYDIATICESVANDGIEVKYNFWGTGMTYGKMASVCRYLKNTAGFGNADLKRSYSTDNIINMLENNKPIIVGAFDIIELSGHAWVIDGMIAQYLYETVGSNSERQRLLRAPLFHCNWGWDGHHDGYYTSEIFRIKKISDNADGTGYGAIITEEDDKTYEDSSNITINYGEASKPRFHYRHITY